MEVSSIFFLSSRSNLHFHSVINFRCREKQRKEASRLQAVNWKWTAMNKLLMEENDRLQKQVSQLVHENNYFRQHTHNPSLPAKDTSCESVTIIFQLFHITYFCSIIFSASHITRLWNKLVQLSDSNGLIKASLQENSEWNEWQSSVLQERNTVENVYTWACGRPTTVHDRTRDSDEEDRDYDVAALANNLSQAFNYRIYGTDDNEEDRNTLDRDDSDAYFGDESAEVVISSLRLGDDQGSSMHQLRWPHHAISGCCVIPLF